MRWLARCGVYVVSCPAQQFGCFARGSLSCVQGALLPAGFVVPPGITIITQPGDFE
jgi:hypothetical protein